MRFLFLLPLTAVVTVAAGCGSDMKQQTSGSVPRRDLTLVTQAAQVEIASPVETHHLRIQHRTAPRYPLEPKVTLAAVANPAPALAPEPATQPVTAAATPANDRELLPGKTVTVIPASSAPSVGSDPTDDLPAAHGRPMVARGGGGTCRGRGRGPGIGIANAPRPDFR